MNKISKAVSVISVLFINFLFFVRSVYADCSIDTCGGGDKPPTSDPYELVVCILAGILIVIIIALSVIGLIKIRERNNKKEITKKK
jgi:hypothetical protein